MLIGKVEFYVEFDELAKCMICGCWSNTTFIDQVSLIRPLAVTGVQIYRSCYKRIIDLDDW